MARMGRLADLALELAEAAQARALQALAAPPDPESPKNPAADLVRAFDRAARAVRLCCTLEARFEAELDPRREAAARAAQARAQIQAQACEQERLAGRTSLDVRRDALRDHVGAAIDLAAGSEREGRLFESALDERLERDCDRLLDGPFGAVMARLCSDLGLDPDWDEWANEDWAIEETRTRAQGSPYADWPLPGAPEPDHADLMRAAVARRLAREAQGP